MTKWVSTDYDGCYYITPGKWYEVKRDDGFIFNITDNVGDYIDCVYDQCPHLNWQSWTVHDKPARDPELTSPYGDGNHPLPPATGTLRELNVKPGDVVEIDGVVNTVLSAEIIPQGEIYGGEVRVNLSKFGWGIFDTEQCRIISRAPTYDPQQEVDHLRNERDALQAVIDGKPKTWREMTDAEKGALLLDWNDNHARNVQQWNGSSWVKMQTGRFGRSIAYRIKPEPKHETVTLYGAPYKHIQWCLEQCGLDTHRITFTTTDGEPDLDSITMERA